MNKVVYTFLCFALFSIALFAKDGAHELIILTAPAKFKKLAGETVLSIADDKHKFIIMPWSSTFFPEGPIRLQSNAVYTFTILQEPLKTKPGTLRFSEVVKIVRQDGKTIYGPGVCEVHYEKMELKEVPIHYGLPGPDPKDPSGSKRLELFPHGRDYMLGGCVRDANSPKIGKTYICKKCKEAYADWLKQAKSAK